MKNIIPPLHFACNFHKNNEATESFFNLTTSLARFEHIKLHN